MSLEDTERVVRAYLDALLTGGDFASFFSDDVVWTTMETRRPGSGPGGGPGLTSSPCTSRPSTPLPSSSTWPSPMTSPPWRPCSSASTSPSSRGVPATGTTVRLPYSVFYGIANQKIAALRAYFPVMALSRQLSQAASAHA